MIQEEPKNEYRALAMSVLVHFVIFVLIAMTGLFVKVKAIDQGKPIDVMVYDADAGDGGGGGGGGGEPAPADAAPPSMDDIVVKDEVMPELAKEEEKYKEVAQAEAQQAEEKEEQHSSAAASPNANVNTAPGGTGTGGTGGGTGGGNGTGNGPGNGSGTGPGSGSGSGGGNGSGHGTGNGAGDGNGDAQRPKTPPHLVSAVTPLYPENLRLQSIEGVVRVRLVVGTDGEVESASVAESSGYSDMDSAAVNAAYDYRFSPAENVYGDPVRCAITTTIRFRLN